MKTTYGNDYDKEGLKEELMEKKALPLSRPLFDAMFERVWNYAEIPHQEGFEEYLKKSARHAVANMIMHLSPTEDFKEDAYFVKALRKACVNEVSYAIIEEIKAQKKAEQEAKTQAI